MKYLLVALLAVLPSLAIADGNAELAEWRRRVGLPRFTVDANLTRFAQMKAEYRAKRGLKDGHQGPRNPPGTREGCGEASAHWGLLVCSMEEDFTHAGVGIAIGGDGERYMVAVFRGGSGRALIPRQNIPIHNTSYLTPNPPRMGWAVSRSVRPPQRRGVCAKCGRVH